MYLFKMPIRPLEKERSHHPWDRTIKDIYSSEIIYFHNSIYNPHYPMKKGNANTGKDRVLFTVIGNRVSKEFIYCANLVKGLHKYRRKLFDSPVIRGLTSVEWPKAWHDLKIQYGTLAHCLTTEVAVLYNGNFLGGDKELIELVEKKYDYHLSLNFEKESVALFTGFVRSLARPCVYMHISVDDQYIGTLIFVLFADILPCTCENFLRLCKEKRGGYSGTPIHRIVKHCWIQCGGFGLKSTDLDCENFIVPFDGRGVLAMANDGRHVDCSTQFFVLLQPAPWMQQKYVAFGQLIDGESTLQKIEDTPTWYESPKSNIIINQSGILNLDCQDIIINRGANEYIEGHIDDLVVVGDLFMELLLQKVNLEIEFRCIQSLLVEPEGEDADEKKKQVDKRLQLKKEEIGKQLEKAVMESHRTTPGPSQAVSRNENQQFDVDEYSYEPEEFTYTKASSSTCKPANKEKPYYLPLTDVPYPGEIDSNYDLQRFLRGDYCAETDLSAHPQKLVPSQQQKRKMSYISDIFDIFDYSAKDGDSDDDDDENDMDSEEEAEVKKYLKENTDRVSFAGGIVKNIAKTNKGNVSLFETSRKSELITDDMLRKVRLASVDFRRRDSRKVSISAPSWDKEVHTQIKRRQTGFKSEDLERILIISRRSSIVSEDSSDEETHDPKVHIKASDDDGKSHDKHFKRRPTAFVFPKNIQAAAKATDDDEEEDKDNDEDEVKVRMSPSATESAPTDIHSLKRRPTTFVRPGSMPIDDENDDDEDTDKKYDVKEESDEELKVHIAASAKKTDDSHFKRRATTFVRPGAIPFDEDDEDDHDGDNEGSDSSEPKVHMAPTTETTAHDAEIAHMKRRATTFVRPGTLPIDDDDDDDDDEDQPKVHMAPATDTTAHDAEIAHIKRRATTFVRPGTIPIDDDEDDIDEDEPKVHIMAPATDTTAHDDDISHIKRRPTTFVRPGSIPIDDDEDDDEDPKVQMAPSTDTTAHDAEFAKRRPTTFVRPGSIPIDDDDDDDDDNDDDRDQPHVQIASDQANDYAAQRHQSIRRRPTAFVRAADLSDDEDNDDEHNDDGDKNENGADKENKRPSLLQRLVDENRQHDHAPTLKNYKPLSEMQRDNIFLTPTSTHRLNADTDKIEKSLVRTSVSVEYSTDKVLDSLKADRKMSTDYGATIEKLSHRTAEKSIRSMEYARHRPTMTVSEYQQKNINYRAEQKRLARMQTISHP